MLYGFPASMVAIREYGDTAPSIAEAATQDPLFPLHAAGAEATACLLVAWAWQVTRFMKSAAPQGTFGLYALRPPKGTKVAGSTMTIVRTASLVAIDRMREGMQRAEGRPVHERLAPFVEECFDVTVDTLSHARAALTSREVMRTSSALLARHYPNSDGKLLLGR